MTPKEKAKQLVEKYLPHVRGADRYNYNLESMNAFIAKKCALIAVDEIMKDGAISWADTAHEPYEHTTHFEYWQQVKQEINDL